MFINNKKKSEKLKYECKFYPQDEMRYMYSKVKKSKLNFLAPHSINREPHAQYNSFILSRTMPSTKTEKKRPKKYCFFIEVEACKHN